LKIIIIFSRALYRGPSQSGVLARLTVESPKKRKVEEKMEGYSNDRRHTSWREGKAIGIEGKALGSECKGMGNELFWLCSKENQFNVVFISHMRNFIDTGRSKF
jgi:hypothetical protein